MSGVLPASAGMTTKATQTDREKLHVVAKQFEAVFLRQMMSAARKTSFSEEGSVGDISGGQAMDTFRQMQDEHFADATAETGTIGLAKILEAQMARFVPAGPADTAATSAAPASAAPASVTPASANPASANPATPK